MGGMSGEAKVADEARKLNLPITFFKPSEGFLSAQNYYAKIKNSRILFAPSHEEGWGIAVCEAMACGLPVIAYDLPAYRKIYSDSYKSIDCFDPEKFANAIVDVLDSPSVCSDLEKKGYSVSQKYDWDAIAKDDWNFVF
jgi:glycosyltransferase involved in cell wall biosynthesis